MHRDKKTNEKPAAESKTMSWWQWLFDWTNSWWQWLFAWAIAWWPLLFLLAQFAGDTSFLHEQRRDGSGFLLEQCCCAISWWLKRFRFREASGCQTLCAIFARRRLLIASFWALPNILFICHRLARQLIWKKEQRVFAKPLPSRSQFLALPQPRSASKLCLQIRLACLPPSSNHV